mgnify:CR=1 FL=1
MGKSLYIAEKPSVAQEFAKALHINTKRKDGYLESEETIVTWCVGHLVTMSYPEEYDPALKRWSLETLPFIPQEFKYEVIPAVAKQFRIVSGLLNREDVDTIYVCTDSGREGEYIYRLVEQQAGVKGKNRRRVWIDSQTEEEILRGIKEAKNLNEYDNLAASAYLRAKEDYLMGINFSRLLTLKYGNSISNYLNTKYSVVSVGRVMTCVLGMVVRREREIREFVETPFYRVLSTIGEKGSTFEGEWRAVKGSKWFESFDLYKENGFKKKEKAEELIRYLSTDQPVGNSPLTCQIVSIEKKKEKKKWLVDFNSNHIMYDSFPFATWSRIMRQTLLDKENSFLSVPEKNGVMELREAIADHLQHFRGMNVNPDNIIVGAGTEYLYSIIVQLLGRDKVIAVEDPGYKKIGNDYGTNSVAQCP